MGFYCTVFLSMLIDCMKNLGHVDRLQDARDHIIYMSQ